MKTIASALFDSAKHHAQKTAFYHFNNGGIKTVTYAEFASSAGAVAGHLDKEGISPGDRVVLIAENSPLWCASYLGLSASGGIAVPLDTRLTPPEINNLIKDSGARFILHSSATEKLITDAVADNDARLVNIDLIEPSPSQGRWRSENPPGVPDIAALLYTSGTTGMPKAVVLTHDNFLSDARAVLKTGIIGQFDNVIAVLPLYHTYAFMCTFLAPLIAGASVTYPESLKGPDIIRASRQTNATVLIAVPQLLSLMLDRINGRIKNLPAPMAWGAMGFIKLSSAIRNAVGLNIMGMILGPLGRRMRYLTSGGARLDPKVMIGLESLGFTVLEGYGLTETAPVVCFNPVNKRKPGSVGKALDPARIMIVDDTGREAARYMEGEILIQGPMVMRGYNNMPEVTARAMKDGWFKSGDLGHMDKDGYVFITGRKKEVIVLSSGKNIYPEEVEGRYAESGLIKEICVMLDMDRLKAVIVPDFEFAKQSKIANIGEALKWEISALSESIPPHMRIKGFTMTSNALPRTALGKLKRYVVASEFKGEPARHPESIDREAVEAELMRDTVGKAVIDSIRPLIKEDRRITGGDNLELDLGMDSLGRIEMAAGIEKSLGIKLTDDLIASSHTVGELINGIKEIARSGAAYARPGAARDGLDAVLNEEPAEDELGKAGMGQAVWWQWPASVTLIAMLKTAFKLFFGLSAKGLENLPQRPYIIAANHASYLDGFAAGCSVPLGVFRNLYFLGEERFFRGGMMSLFTRVAHVIAIDRDAHLGRALRMSSACLRRGNAILIFPEGGRTFDGNVMKFRKGIGILAMKLNVPVVPAWIEGAAKALPRGAALPVPAKITVAFGKPVWPDDYKADGPDEYQGFSDTIRERIIELRAKTDKP